MQQPYRLFRLRFGIVRADPSMPAAPSQGIPGRPEKPGLDPSGPVRYPVQLLQYCPSCPARG